MPVPETPIHEDYSPVFGQNNIGLSWHSLLVQPKPESFAMQALPDRDLRPRVYRPDRCHIAAAGRAVVDVSQLS